MSFHGLLVLVTLTAAGLLAACDSGKGHGNGGGAGDGGECGAAAAVSDGGASAGVRDEQDREDSNAGNDTDDGAGGEGATSGSAGDDTDESTGGEGATSGSAGGGAVQAGGASAEQAGAVGAAATGAVSERTESGGAAESAGGSGGGQSVVVGDGGHGGVATSAAGGSEEAQSGAGSTSTGGTQEPGSGGSAEPGSGGSSEPGSGGSFEPGSGGSFEPGSGGSPEGVGGSSSGGSAGVGGALPPPVTGGSTSSSGSAGEAGEAEKFQPVTVTLVDGGTVSAGPVEITALEGTLAGPIAITVSPVELPEPLPEAAQLVGIGVDISLDHPEYLGAPLLVELTYDDTGLESETPMTVLHYDEEYGYEQVTMHDHDADGNLLLFDSWSFSSFFGVLIDTLKLVESELDTGFRPTADGWAIHNFGNTTDNQLLSPFSGGGNCLGMAAYASWFYDRTTIAGERLYDAFDPGSWLPDKLPSPPIEQFDKYVSLAHLAVMRAHQAQSQAEAYQQWVPSTERTGEDQYWRMLYELTVHPQTPLLFRMRTDDWNPVEEGNQPGGHIGVLYRWEATADTLWFYDPNRPGSSEPKIVFSWADSRFQNYEYSGARWDGFGIIGRPTLGRRGSFNELASDVHSGFLNETTITLNTPRAGQAITGTETAIVGQTHLRGTQRVFLYVNDTTRTELSPIAADGSFNFPAMPLLSPGQNEIVFLAGKSYPKPNEWQSADSWQGATLVRRVCASADGSLEWNVDRDRCECPEDRATWEEMHCSCPEEAPSWNPDTAACEPCPSDRPVWNVDTKACKACSEAEPRWNPDTEVCEACPDEQPRFDSTTQACDACPGAQSWDVARRTCVCPPELPAWNPETQLCESCSIGLVWNPDLSVCERPDVIDSGVSGDPHLYTWDGHFYDVQSVGEFVLATDGAEFVVHARTQPLRGNDRVSWITSVAANVHGARVQIDAGGSSGPILWVNGVSSAPGALPQGGQVSVSDLASGGHTALVEWVDGPSLRVTDNGSYLDVELGALSGSLLQGLLGDADGVPENDLALRDGTPLELYLDDTAARAYADSWRITAEESLFRYAAGESTLTYTDLGFPYALSTVAALDHGTYAAAKLICEDAGITDEALLEACILDVGMTGDVSLTAATADIPPPVSAGPSVYELVAASEVVDADLVSEAEPVADGAFDRVFDVSVRGPLTSLVLVTAHRYGATTDAQIWDTLVDDQPIPLEVGSAVTDGSLTWVLGVEEDGALLNKADGSIPTLSAGVHQLRLYVADPGSLPEGQRFRLFGATPDGFAVAGPVTDGSDPEGDVGQFCTAAFTCNAGYSCMLDDDVCRSAYGLDSEMCCVLSDYVGGEGEYCGAGGACDDGLSCVDDRDTCRDGYALDVSRCCSLGGLQMEVHQEGYVTTGSWQGYAWVAVDDPSARSTITPADFSSVAEGGSLCVAGTVAPEPEYQSVAMLGINLNQSLEAGEGSELTWSTEGYSGIRYSVSNPGGSALRLQIQGTAGYPDEAWCAEIGTAEGSGLVRWSDFNTRCWDNDGSAYPTDVALDSVMLLVGGDTVEDVPFDFCIADIGPFQSHQDPCRGPDGYCWDVYASGSSSAMWVEPVSDAAAHVLASSAPYEAAGLTFGFDEANGAVDLSGYDQLVFDAVVATGEPFEVVISEADAWCKWELTGVGTSRYTVELALPSQCGPTACGYDLQAQWVSFSAPWGGDAGASADILVSHVEFVTTGSGAGVVRAGDGGPGPGGRCWNTFVFGGVGTSEWVELSSAIAHVRTTTTGDAEVGMSMELLPVEQDLSGYSRLEFDGDITAGEFFEVVAVRDSSWCWWNLEAAGAATYSVDLTSPDGCGGADPMAIRTLTQVTRLDFEQYRQAELEMAVTDIRFVPGITVHETGYVASGPWQGYAWTGVEDPSVGSTITPADFLSLAEGESLCAAGIVAADADFQGYAVLGVNLNQSVEAGEGSALTWSPEGYSGIRYAISNPGGSRLRLELQGAAGYPDEFWCAEISAVVPRGLVEWSDFNTSCWDGSGTSYPGDTPLRILNVQVPGNSTDAEPFELCISALEPF